jgi:hypothetical protein
MTMTNDELFTLQHARYLLAEYSPLCVAAGYDIAQFGGVDCFALATMIQGQVRRSARVITKGVFVETDYIGAIKKMTLAELSAMRSRINFRPMRSSR